MKKRMLALLLGMSVLLGAVPGTEIPAFAGYPEKTVTYICGFPPGGAMDMTARAITEAAKKNFPRPMVVVNRPGASGTIGAAEIIQAKPDGYTIGITAVAVLTIQPHRTKLPYGSPEEYTPILRLVNLPICLAVRANAPWKTVQEYLAYGKANPGKIRLSHPGMGTILHLNAEQLKRMSGVDFTIAPLTGAAEQIPALLGGHVESAAIHHGEILPHVQAGKAKVLAVFEEKRHPLFPDAPAFREIGFDITMGVYYVTIGPKGLPPEILSSLHDALKKGMEDPSFVAPMKAKGFDVAYEGPADIKRRLLQDYEKNSRLVEELQLKGK